MPLDTRRVTGPESSQDYKVFSKKYSNKKVGGEKQRENGREDGQHRPIFLNTGIITKARGSAYVELGDTKVICAIYGPREIPRKSDFSMSGILSCTFERTPFARPVRRGWGQQSQDEGETSSAIAQALEATVCMHMYPKSQIDVYITVLEDAGSSLAAALTCAGLALSNGAIHMFDTLVGASLKRVGQRRLVDPTLNEEETVVNDEDSGCVTVGYQPSLEQIALLSQEGHMSADSLMSDVRHLTQLCNDLVPNVHKCLVDSVKAST